MNTVFLNSFFSLFSSFLPLLFPLSFFFYYLLHYHRLGARAVGKRKSVRVAWRLTIERSAVWGYPSTTVGGATSDTTRTIRTDYKPIRLLDRLMPPTKSSIGKSSQNRTKMAHLTTVRTAPSPPPWPPTTDVRPGPFYSWLIYLHSIGRHNFQFRQILKMGVKLGISLSKASEQRGGSPVCPPSWIWHLLIVYGLR